MQSIFLVHEILNSLSRNPGRLVGLLQAAYGPTRALAAPSHPSTSVFSGAGPRTRGGSRFIAPIAMKLETIPSTVFPVRPESRVPTSMICIYSSRRDPQFASTIVQKEARDRQKCHVSRYHYSTHALSTYFRKVAGRSCDAFRCLRGLTQFGKTADASRARGGRAPRSRRGARKPPTVHL